MKTLGMSLVLFMGILSLVGCEESLGPLDSPTSLEPAARPSTALYTYIFTGDIQGSLENVAASSGDPFKQVTTEGLAFSFPTASTGDTSVCNQEQPSLAPSVNDWGGYDEFSWAGAIDLSRKKRSSFHLQITGMQSDGSGSINLAVNDVPVVDTNTGTVAVIEFENARALISALSYSETDGGGSPIYDPDDRCVNFTITATRQP